MAGVDHGGDEDPSRIHHNYRHTSYIFRDGDSLYEVLEPKPNCACLPRARCDLHHVAFGVGTSLLGLFCILLFGIIFGIIVIQTEDSTAEY